MKHVLKLFLFLLFSQDLLALPIFQSFDPEKVPHTMSVSGFNFEGIVALSNCSGALVRYNQSLPQDRALILTNGHCVEFGFPKPGKIHLAKPSNRSFGLLDRTGRTIGQLRATTLVYATMTKTDFALYQLKETYQEIETKFKVAALTLLPYKSQDQVGIEVISGYWRRGFSCSINGFVREMREDGYQWVDSIRYSRPGCDVYGGTSGSPVILTGTRWIVGVNNTGNESGYLCTINNPCEIGNDGRPVSIKGNSYGQQSYWVYSCLNNINEIDLNKPGCLLYKD